MTKIKVNRESIEDESLFCPYCGDEVSYSSLGCCGESSAHFETGYLVDGEILLESEIEIIENSENRTTVLKH